MTQNYYVCSQFSRRCTFVELYARDTDPQISILHMSMNNAGFSRLRVHTRPQLSGEGRQAGGLGGGVLR